MTKKSKRVFENDKMMELRVRLAMKRAGDSESGQPDPIEARPPARDLLDRLILRVEQL